MKRTLLIEPTTVAVVRRLYASGEARRLRLRYDLSLADIAGPAEVSVPTVWKLERQMRTPRGSTAMRLAPVLSSLLELEAAEG